MLCTVNDAASLLVEKQGLVEIPVKYVNISRDYYINAKLLYSNSKRECCAKANDTRRQWCARMLCKSECCYEATAYENAMQSRALPGKDNVRPAWRLGSV